MNPVLRPLLVAVALLPLGGCLVRLSHRELPDVAGVVTRHGAPLADVPVRAVARTDADGEPARHARITQTRTDADGRFRLAPHDERDWVLITGAMDQGAFWSLQAFADGRWQPIWKAGGLAGPAVPLVADCDLAAAPSESQAGRGGGSGICRLRLATRPTSPGETTP